MLFKIKRDQNWKLSFSIMLAEELFREGLKSVFGDQIRVFRSEITATKPGPRNESLSKATCTHEENRWTISPKMERYITIAAIVGPFEKTYSESPKEDKRRNLRQVWARIRLFSTANGCIWWKPHFMFLTQKNANVESFSTHSFYYETGMVDGSQWFKSNENPCEDMCDSQTTANYPDLHDLDRTFSDQDASLRFARVLNNQHKEQ
jgi:hypothetical protein